VEAGDRDSGLRLAELLAAFSLTSDLGLGQPMEHVLRSWLIAGRLGDRMGLGAEARVSQLAATLVLTGGRAVERGLMSHCLATTQMAGRLGLPADVCDPLRQVFTRWDAKGVPEGVGGEQIARPVRLFHLADTVEVFHRAGGVDAAVEVARARRGSQFDPDVVDLFCAAAAEVLADMDAVAESAALIEAEPGLRRQLTERELDSALEVVADFTDLRSPSRAGHSRGVADLAAAAARLCGRPDGEVLLVRRAALVHDLGMHGVSASILDKPGHLTGTETERLRLHSYWTERSLARPPALARIGAIASLTCERLDGSGYHRGLSGAAIPATGRILAAADVCRALSEPRPHRPPLSPKQAAAELRAEVRAGRPDPARARGAHPHRPRRVHPPGRPRPRHHGQDRRHPHRAHLRQDRRLDPDDRHAVRDAAWPARHPQPNQPFITERPGLRAPPPITGPRGGRHTGEMIRLGTPADLAAARSVYRRASLSNAGDRDNLLAHPEYLILGPEGLAEGRTYVAEQDSTVVGFASWADVDGVIELEDLFVDPDYMRRGIATELVRHVAAAVRARGVERLEVTANPHAMAFYHCAGFIDCGVAETEFYPGTRMVLMLS
jgi:HD-GYP domain-containing protein (c-di-GMP phosphodiesterase class II)/ribosomal protein S18 acetylase RimI-like enzyme